VLHAHRAELQPGHSKAGRAEIRHPACGAFSHYSLEVTALRLYNPTRL